MDVCNLAGSVFYAVVVNENFIVDFLPMVVVVIVPMVLENFEAVVVVIDIKHHVGEDNAMLTMSNLDQVRGESGVNGDVVDFVNVEVVNAIMDVIIHPNL